jgi:RimJ/RimL family protein N-acetyltransferase
MPLFPRPPSPILTPRLVVRAWEHSDAAALAEAVHRSREHLLPWLPWAAASPQSIAEQEQVLASFHERFEACENFVYGIFARDGEQAGCVIGGTGLHPRLGPGVLEIGYWIHVDHVRRGYATEASAALTRVGIERLGADAVEIRCDPDNVPSAAIPRHLGFADTGVSPQIVTGGDPDVPRDTRVFRMEAARLPGTPAAAVVFETPADA